ncbi:30S ribosomal protein S3ae [Caldivirga sp.]
MAQAQQAAAQQRIPLGKWAFKKWLTVYAPAFLGGQAIVEIPVDEPSRAIGRNVETTLYDLTKDLSHINVKLRFRVSGVDGDRALTQFNGMELTRDYVRNLVRRGSSKVMVIKDVTTKDGGKLRMEVLAITTYRCTRTHKHLIRKSIMDRLDRISQETDFDSLVRDSIMGKVQVDLFNVAKKVYPLRKVEVVKIKVLEYPKKPEAKPPMEAIKVAQEVTQQQQQSS